MHMARVGRHPDMAERGRPLIPSQGRDVRAYSATRYGQGIPGYSFARNSTSSIVTSPEASATKYIDSVMSPSQRNPNQRIPHGSACLIPTDKGIHGPFLRGSVDRVTSPGRIATQSLSPLVRSSQQAKSDDLLARPGESSSQGLQPGRITASQDELGDSKVVGTGRFSRADCRYASTPARLRAEIASARCRYFQDQSLTSASDEPTQRTFSECDSEVFTSNALEETSAEDKDTMNQSQDILDNKDNSVQDVSKDFMEGTVVAKQLITKEYVQVQSVSYLEALEKEKRGELLSVNSQTRRIMADFFRGGFRRSTSRSPFRGSQEKIISSRSESMPASPMHQPKQGRSHTLPEEHLLAGDTTPTEPIRKSHSSNILSLLKRLSPRAFRRRPTSKNSVSDGSKPTTPGSSEDVDFDNRNGIGMSYTASSPLLPDQNAASNMGKQGLTAQSPQSPAKQRGKFKLPKSPKKKLFGGRHQAKSPTEKATVMNSAASEALPLKPQTLKTFEFPDNLLEHNNSGVIPEEDHPSCNGTADGVQQPRTRRAPPVSLAVRNVAKMGRNRFPVPSASYLSVESIGQCSLDVEGT